MPTDARATAIFNIFASRAAAELRRLRLDRSLRDREQKLSHLIDSAMDAIVELDGALCITHMNHAAAEVFGCNAADVAGRSLGLFLNNESRGRLLSLIRELERRPEGKQSLWFPHGLEAIRADGAGFPAEATVSRFELDGLPFYTLILRNINERLEAEERNRALMRETTSLRAEIDTLQGFDDITGQSEALHRVLCDVEQVAKGDTTVLITGETGTGKELIARAIHQHSLRAHKPLIKVNCAAIPATLQESELFGHEKGAFTGATQRRDGRFKLADGGTIFLGEVGELPLDLQAKLLRVLQEGEFEPVGSSKLKRYDWPGNIRELQNVIERAFITSQDSRTLNLERALPEDMAHVTAPGRIAAPTISQERILTDAEIRQLEKDNMVCALTKVNWKISSTGGAAELLGLNPNTLSSRMKSLGIERPRRS
jgi:PAS domain S-box-containing protein